MIAVYAIYSYDSQAHLESKRSLNNQLLYFYWFIAVYGRSVTGITNPSLTSDNLQSSHKLSTYYILTISTVTNPD